MDTIGEIRCIEGRIKNYILYIPSYTCVCVCTRTHTHRFTDSNERLSSLRFTRCVINHAFTNKLALGLKQCTRLRTLNLDALTCNGHCNVSLGNLAPALINSKLRLKKLILSNNNFELKDFQELCNAFVVTRSPLKVLDLKHINIYETDIKYGIDDQKYKNGLLPAPMLL